jgi:azurin
MNKILVIFLGLFTTKVFAIECNVNLETTQSMAYKTNEIVIKKSCSEVTLNFKNNGTFPKTVMGHNVVISKKSDM